jgi:hypothetical protein
VTGALGVSAAQALLPEEEITYCPRGTGVTDQTHRKHVSTVTGTASRRRVPQVRSSQSPIDIVQLSDCDSAIGAGRGQLSLLARV